MENLKFKNGKLKIMHITDTHLDDDNIEMSVWLINEGCKKEMPDIAIITGDNVHNEDDPKKTKAFIDKLMNVFEEKGVPVAVTFGNHDSERGAMSREELMAYYNSFSCSVSRNMTNLPDCATFNVPVMAEDGSEMKFNLWVIDSNDYDDEGHYGCVLPPQVEWYKNKSDELTNANNGKIVPSLAFQHMIVEDVYQALTLVKRRKLYSFPHMYNKKDFYMFNPKMQNFGTLNETPCSGYHNYGQFEAMVEKGDVLGIFSGHDHTNAFAVKYKGIDIGNSLSTRYNDDRFSSQYGYRILEVNEADPTKYTSRVERWYKMFSFKDLKKIKKKGTEFDYRTAKSVTIKGIPQRFMTKTGRVFCHLVTGRKNTYKH